MANKNTTRAQDSRWLLWSSQYYLEWWVHYACFFERLSQWSKYTCLSRLIKTSPRVQRASVGSDFKKVRLACRTAQASIELQFIVVYHLTWLFIKSIRKVETASAEFYKSRHRSIVRITYLYCINNHFLLQQRGIFLLIWFDFFFLGAWFGVICRRNRIKSSAGDAYREHPVPLAHRSHSLLTLGARRALHPSAFRPGLPDDNNVTVENSGALCHPTPRCFLTRGHP